MGCLFSSGSAEDQGDRRRKNAQNEESTLPNPQNANQNQQNANTTNTQQIRPNDDSPALNMNRNMNTLNKNKQLNGLSRVLGTSITDNQQREAHILQNVIQQARLAFIDIAAQRRQQITPLSPQALSLTAQCEVLLSSEMVPNLRNGFFESHVPFTVHTSVDTNPNSNAENSVDNIVNQILDAPNFQMVELAYACAQEACYALIEGTVQVVQSDLLITQAEFEDQEQ